ncbi:MAG: DUF6427 family protein [Bacteroidota bacterium]
MVLKIVRSNSPVVLLFFLLISFGLWYPAFNSPEMIPFSFDEAKMPLYELLYNWLAQKQFLRVFVPYILILIQAVYILKINREYILVQRQNYLPSLIFIIITGSFIELQRINPGIFANLFIILMLNQVFSSYRKRYVLNRLFMAGIFVGIAGMFYSFAIVYLVIIWISLFLLRSIDLREWFVPVLGVIFPFLFLFSVYYIHDELTITGLIETIKANIKAPVSITHYQTPYYIFYAILGLFVIFGSFSIIKRFPGRKIYIRKFFEILWWMFVGPVLMLIFMSQIYGEIIYFIAVPITYLIADYVNSIKNRTFGNVMILLLLASLVYVWVSHV